ncbi:heterokaryon incompatibility protein-domain-containing protein [Cadophora sp. MPI-SDFR-AT-0126]|nr:heterokaryon incompatibility protein-domain-containing protein [Leotiomycetes sp. MPI-SDFR-AT-0126]
MASARPSFVYAPLDTSFFEIRLIRLQPRDPANPDLITCSLKHAGLEDPDSIYEALSYEWGSETKTPCSIILNDVCLPVREKLFSALWHLRDQGEVSSVRVIWIDALCINQSDDIEKAHQVSQMGNIYSHASRVVAWVGLNIQHIPKSRRDPSLAWDQRDSAACSVSSMSDLVEVLRDPGELTFKPSDYLKWGAILAFCDRTYWTRLWIIQEVILAPRILVQAGAYSFDFTLLEKAFKKHGALWKPAFTDELKSSMDFIAKTTLYLILAHRCYRQEHNISLLRHVHLFRESVCFDPRDKIFGVLEVGPACCKANIAISYRKSEWENLHNLFRHHFQDHKSDTDTLSDYQIRSIIYYFSQRGRSPCSWNSALPSEISLDAGDSAVASIRSNLLGIVLDYQKGPQNEMLIGHYTSEETNILYSKHALPESTMVPSARTLDSSDTKYFEGTSRWPDAEKLRNPALRDDYESFRQMWDSGAVVYGWTNRTGAMNGGKQLKNIDLVTEEISASKTYGDARPGDLVCSVDYGRGAMVLRRLHGRLVIVMFMMDTPLFPNERWRWRRTLYLNFTVLRAYHEFMMFGPGSSFEISQIDHGQLNAGIWDPK